MWSSRRRLSQSPTRSHGLFHQYVQLQYFNSRLRKETNQYVIWLFLIDHYFNSRLLGETNYDDPELEVLLDTFQLTSPFGDELQILVLGTYSSYFNSHPREGMNSIIEWSVIWDKYFNSRLREETNRKILGNSHQKKYFKSRLRKETNRYCSV